MALTGKQARFVAEYMVDLNATQAAVRAGYSQKTAYAQGWENLKKPEIVAEIAKQKAAQLEKAGLSADRTLNEMRRIAFSDIRKLFTDWGGLKPIPELGDEEAAVVASFEVIKKNLFAGDKKVDTIHKLKVWDKLKALEMLGKHFGLLEEKIAVSGSLEIVIRKPWLDK